MKNIMVRLMDISFSLVFLVLFWWIYVIAAIGIKITSPGPVLYKAKRIGKNGHIFDCYKFRSMRVDSGKVRLTTLVNDERIFPFGKFMRTAKIDEIPQIFNILKGEMSVVGPRPEDVENATNLYTGEYKIILSVNPGLTSPASLYDYTHGESYEDMELYEREFMPKKLALEAEYVRNKSLAGDVQIILNTAFIIIAKTFGKRNFKDPFKSIAKG